MRAKESFIARIDEYGDDFSQSADALNDLAYLRWYQKILREKVELIFNKNVFITNDGAYT